jgi:transposase
MAAQPKIIELNVDDLQSRLNEIERVMGEEVVRPFRILLEWYVLLLNFIKKKDVTITRLRRLLFGARTERTRNVVPPSNSDTSPSDDGQDGCLDNGSPKPNADNRGRRRPERGHGRTPAAAYTGCERIVVTHPNLQPGCCCPDCGDGKVYRLSGFSYVVRLMGQAPVGGTRYELERFRCGLCGKLFTAPLPEEAGEEKYDATVASVVATLRYGEGMPWNRIQRIQQFAGIPLPASVQWEQVRDAVARGIGAAYRQLLFEAAQGDLIHNDDTRMRVLELTARTKNLEPLREDQPQRRGVFTTGFLSVADGRPAIALFFTGPRHSGENLRELLAARMASLPPPIQMCDALSRNTSSDLETIVAHCLSHGRRNFYELADVFPAEVHYVLTALKKVYRVDRKAKAFKLSPDDRLRLHQRRSGPVMEELHRWLNEQIDERKVEPNSSLGQAITYMLKHWEPLTLFLRVPGAPLDNNVCEQALKMAIRHRNNSLFYKTQQGAHIGDLYMTLIHSCYLAGADPMDYLTRLQRNQEAVFATPVDWMPWNYRQQLATDLVPAE